MISGRKSEVDRSRTEVFQQAWSLQIELTARNDALAVSTPNARR